MQSTPAIAQTAPQVPRTRAQLSALNAQRSELREQLASVTDRRGRLVQERLNAQAAGNATVVRELDGRIAELGDRSRQLERALTQTDDAIAKGIIALSGAEEAEPARAPRAPRPPLPAVPDVPAIPGVIEIPSFRFQDRGNMVDRDVLIASLLGEALAFVLIGAVLMRRAFRRGQREALASGARDPQLQQSIDAIALEVERISENQRFVTKLLHENAGAGKIS